MYQKIESKRWRLVKEMDGVLFFAKVIIEMLSEDTLDSYKAPSLNLRTSMLEFRSLCIKYKSGSVKKGALDFSIDELSDRLARVNFLPSDSKSRYQKYVTDLKAKFDDPEGLCRLVDLLVYDCGALYWECVRKSITSGVHQWRDKERIFELVAEFVAELQYVGYSRKYILQKTKKFFFSNKVLPKEISSPCQVAEFVDLFDGRKKEWTVLCKRTVGAMGRRGIFTHCADLFWMSIRKGVPASLKGDAGCAAFVGSGGFSHLFELKNIEALDPHAAYHVAESKLDFFFDICRFHYHKEAIASGDTAFVYDVKSQRGYNIGGKPKPMENGVLHMYDGHEDRFRMTLDILAGDYFDIESRRRFRKVLDYHHAAMQSSSHENQLLDLWAALEGFLPRNAQTNRDKIVVVMDYLVPILSLVYNYKIFRHIADELARSEVTLAHVEATPVEGDYFFKLVALLVCQDLTCWRTDLNSYLLDKPELRYKIHRISQNYKSSAGVCRAIVRHEKKVRWQIQRIYTLRNQIIHNAEGMPYLPAVIENMHDYLDVVVMCVARAGKCVGNRTSIDVCFDMIASLYRQYIESVKRKKYDLNILNLSEAIFGKSEYIERIFKL